MAQQQRHGKEPDDLGNGGHVAVAPRRIATPVRKFCVEADVRKEQQNKSDEVSPDLGTKTPPREHPDDNGEHQQRVDRKMDFSGESNAPKKPTRNGVSKG